jgi:copper(I)-binding protein
MKSNLFIASCLLALPLFATSALADGITVDDAYLRVTGVRATTAAAFMTIENTSATEDRLIGVRSDAAQRVELHTHSQDANGVMSMGEIEGGIAVGAGNRHALMRGMDHVMLMGLTAPLADGDAITLTLTFETAGDVVIEVPVDNNR